MKIRSYNYEIFQLGTRFQRNADLRRYSGESSENRNCILDLAISNTHPGGIGGTYGAIASAAGVLLARYIRIVNDPKPEG